ncbi:helix-turn-helix domain-containing protein [Bosea sp. Root381]|uniref:helix-turn-helix domain-containing protein n=1 Tax=Bosea sp. Root381 TaxID=1736524 RepID=UPI0006F4BCF6|nr:helix-turn-helix domain-containing protein [Bosea sp. Root381]
MTKSIMSLSTAMTPAPLRPHYWGQALGTLCGRLHADTFGGSTIDGHIDYATIWQLRLCQIEVSRHRIAHRATPGEPCGQAIIKVLFQTCGTSLFEQDGRRLVIAPGDCLAYDVSRAHVISSSALTKHDVVIIPKHLLEQRGLSVERFRAQQVSARDGAGRLAHEVFISVFNQAPALAPSCEMQVAEALLDLVLLPFLSPFDLQRSPRAALAGRIKSYIAEHLNEPELSVEQLAVALDRTKRYLHMAFAEEGTTISGYIWQKRLEKCLHELEARPRSGRTLTDIAFFWGFSSSSHFTHLFKKRYGMPPSAIPRPGDLANARLGLAPLLDEGGATTTPTADGEDSAVPPISPQRSPGS